MSCFECTAGSIVGCNCYDVCALNCLAIIVIVNHFYLYHSRVICTHNTH